MPSIEFYEEFRESGEWMARFDYRTSETLIGTWKKRGNEICVIITDADVKSRVTGKEVCRSFYERDGVLSIRDVRDQKRELFVEINKLGDK